VVTVLPFGNFSVKGEVTGPQLEAMLEHGLALVPTADGRFPQISGLCVTYDIQQPAGSRIGLTSVVRPDPVTGSCTGPGVTAVNLLGGSYTIATNDFTASGGDLYPPVPFTSNGETMEFVVREYIAAKTPISPAIQGRITCTDSNLAAAPACPVVLP
jgi:2',3'-cyclic-nucleotide 2'-phosphodiesterase (5'-nucleotidase family)